MCRSQCQAEMAGLMREMRERVVTEGSEGSVDFTTADLTRFTSFRLAYAKISDQVTLIARILLTEECRRRDGWWTSLFYLHGHK